MAWKATDRLQGRRYPREWRSPQRTMAADRGGLGCMSVKPEWVGYLRYCSQAGIGQYDLAKLDVRAAAIDPVKKQYCLHDDMERELRWIGPIDEVSEKLG
jgi:hypothetical protein